MISRRLFSGRIFGFLGLLFGTSQAAQVGFPRQARIVSFQLTKEDWDNARILSSCDGEYPMKICAVSLKHNLNTKNIHLSFWSDPEVLSKEKFLEDNSYLTTRKAEEIEIQYAMHVTVNANAIGCNNPPYTVYIVDENTIEARSVVICDDKNQLYRHVGNFVIMG